MMLATSSRWLFCSLWACRNRPRRHLMIRFCFSNRQIEQGIKMLWVDSQMFSARSYLDVSSTELV